MNKQRLEAFSDGVIAILITIMVLELRAPAGRAFGSLAPLVPTLLSYVVSFVYMGIYWNNHHHLLHATRRIRGGALWANLHLLFWLSLVPFTTSWVGDHPDATAPTATYGVVLLLAGFAYLLLVRTLVASEGPDSLLARAIGLDRKGTISLVCYAVGIALAFVRPWMAEALYVVVALMWLVPDRRIESKIHQRESARDVEHERVGSSS